MIARFILSLCNYCTNIKNDEFSLDIEKFALKKKNKEFNESDSCAHISSSSSVGVHILFVLCILTLTSSFVICLVIIININMIMITTRWMNGWMDG